MKRNASRKILFLTAILLCFCIIFNSGSAFAAVTPVFLDVDSIEIIERHRIVEGKTYSLSAEIIAKYGETEQVEDVGDEAQSTEFTDIPEETTMENASE